MLFYCFQLLWTWCWRITVANIIGKINMDIGSEPWRMPTTVKKKRHLETSGESRHLKGWGMTQLIPVAKFVKQPMLPSTRELLLLEFWPLSVPVRDVWRRQFMRRPSTQDWVFSGTNPRWSTFSNLRYWSTAERSEMKRRREQERMLKSVKGRNVRLRETETQRDRETGARNKAIPWKKRIALWGDNHCKGD